MLLKVSCLLMVFPVFAGSTNGAHADRQQVEARLKEVQLKGLSLNCGDPSMVLGRGTDASSISEFSTIVDRIGDNEMRADLRLYQEHAQKARTLLWQLENSFKEKKGKDLLALNELWGEAVRKAKDSNESLSANLLSTVKRQVGIAALYGSQACEEMRKIRNQKDFPLSLKGPLEDAVENGEGLFKAMAVSKNNFFKDSDGAYFPSIVGDSGKESAKRRLAVLREKIENGIAFYDKKLKEARSRAECPKIMAAQELLRKSLGESNQAARDYAVKEAEASLKRLVQYEASDRNARSAVESHLMPTQ